MSWNTSDLLKHCHNLSNRNLSEVGPKFIPPALRDDCDRIEEFLNVLDGKAVAFTWTAQPGLISVQDVIESILSKDLTKIQAAVESSFIKRLKQAWAVTTDKVDSVLL